MYRLYLHYPEKQGQTVHRSEAIAEVQPDRQYTEKRKLKISNNHFRLSYEQKLRFFKDDKWPLGGV